MDIETEDKTTKSLLQINSKRVFRKKCRYDKI